MTHDPDAIPNDAVHGGPDGARAALPELQWIVDALDDKRAKDIRALHLAPLTPTMEAFVIASAESLPQIQALEEAVKGRMKEEGRMPRHVETPSSRWVLIDFGAVVVHIMSPEAREFYDLEGLWADAEPIEISPT
ncbi:MAG: ribosome silencing factor [Trueperaceae bacterium]|nr:ribosome silencing factor [Trueperaceae bacterium]